MATAPAWAEETKPDWAAEATPDWAGDTTPDWAKPDPSIIPTNVNPTAPVEPQGFKLLTEEPSAAPHSVATAKMNEVLGSAVTKPLWEYLPEDLKAEAERQFSHGREDGSGGIEEGILRGLGNVAKSFTSPIGIATMGMGSLPTAAQKTLSVAFAVDMARHTPEIARELGAEYGKPESERSDTKIAQLITEGSLNTGFAALAASHGLLPRKSSRTPLTDKALAEAPKAIATASEPLLTVSPEKVAPAPTVEAKTPIAALVEGRDYTNMVKPHKVGVEEGLKLTADDVAEVKRVQSESNAEMSAALSRGDNDAFKAAFGKSTFLGGVIEGAERKGPNYDLYQSELASKAKEVGEIPQAEIPSGETTVESPKIELGINRPELERPELKLLTEKDFDSEFKAAQKSVYEAEKLIDDKGLDDITLNERKKIAEAQDRWSAAELERLRRNNLDIHTEDIFRQMIDLADKGTESSYSKFKVLANILKERGGVKESDVVGVYRLLPERITSNPDFIESTGGKLSRFKGWIERLASESRKQLPAPKENAAPSFKVRVGNNPTVQTVVEKMPATEIEIANGEQPVKVRNDKTGQEQVVLESDLTPVVERPAGTKKAGVDLDAELSKRGYDVTGLTKPQKQEVLKRDEAKSKLEAWADRKLAESQSKLFTGLDPELLAAYAVKGSFLVGRGIVRFGEWSAEMIAQFGDTIKPHLDDIFAESLNVLKNPKHYEVEGENIKMRKSAERAVESPDIPPEVQTRIKEAEESFYTQQSMGRVETEVGGMTSEQLSAVPRDSNIYTASQLELAKLNFEKGDNEAGYAVFASLEKEGTRLGQLINQFKMLRGANPKSVAEIVNQQLKKAGKDPLKPEQEAKVIEKTQEAQQATRDLDRATKKWEKEPTDENARTAETALDAANKADVELQSYVGKFQPRSIPATLKSVLQGNLLTPISEVANLVGNMSFLPFRALGRGVATGLDIIDSFIRNRPRDITVQPVTATIEAGKGALRGAAKIPSILAKGTGDTIKGETRAGLHPVRAWINQFAKNPEMPLRGGKLTLKDRVNLAIEGTFGAPAEVMLRGLGAGDQPFREAAKARIVANELKLAKVPRDQWSFAQKFPELFFDKTTMERIKIETLAAIFQRESKTISTVSNWLRGKGDIWDFAVATVAPYKLTPWNIIGEVLSYNPMIAMARTIKESAAGNTRAAKLNASKFFVGSTLTAAGYWLYKNGLIAPSLDEKDETQKSRILAGEVMPPNHINISGLQRKMAGGDPNYKKGDYTVDVFRAGGLAGSFFYMVANIGRDFEKSPPASGTDFFADLITKSTLEQARFGVNQSFLHGVSGLLESVTTGNTDSYIQSWVNTVSSVPLPNTLAAINRSQREYRVDMKADTLSDKVENVIRNKLGMTEYLPLKRDLWGQPMKETPEGRNSIIYQLFDVTKGKQVTDDPVALELYRLWRTTANNDVIPSIPTRNVTVDKKTYNLNPDQYSRLAELVGTERRRIVDALAVNPEFYKYTDEQKIDLLKKVYDIGHQVGRAKFVQERIGTLEAKPTKAGFGN